jgi:predicted DNA-binding antitoxin AbrB/MazE fold protein
MTAVQATYDGQVFVPEKPCNITSGSKVILTIETVTSGISEKQKKLAEFKKLTNEIAELNTTDPLPPEFDEIVSQRLHFREISGL